MTPYEQAKEVYAHEWSARTFEEDLQAHLQCGFVFSRPDFFIMGRPVPSTAHPALIVNPWHRFNSGECDAWLVYLFAGNFVNAFKIMPWPLPLVCFERRNDLRFYPMADIARLSGVSLI